MLAWTQVRVICLEQKSLAVKYKDVRERRANILKIFIYLPFIILKNWILRQYIRTEIEVLN